MASPDRRELNRRLATRVASRSVQQAIGELTPSQRAAAKIVSRAVIRTQIGRQQTFPLLPNVAAWASNPISFTVDKDFRLQTMRPLRTARHEVAHLLEDGPVTGGYASHLTLRAAGTEGSPVGLRSVPGVARQPFGRRMTMAQQRTSRERRPTSATSSTTTRGFSPTQLRRVLETGSPEAKSTAKVLIRKLTMRARARGIDF